MSPTGVPTSAPGHDARARRDSAGAGGTAEQAATRRPLAEGVTGAARGEVDEHGAGRRKGLPPPREAPEERRRVRPDGRNAVSTRTASCLGRW